MSRSDERQLPRPMRARAAAYRQASYPTKQQATQTTTTSEASAVRSGPGGSNLRTQIRSLTGIGSTKSFAPGAREKRAGGQTVSDQCG
jgi:hypothetical protein